MENAWGRNLCISVANTNSHGLLVPRLYVRCHLHILAKKNLRRVHTLKNCKQVFPCAIFPFCGTTMKWHGGDSMSCLPFQTLPASSPPLSPEEGEGGREGRERRGMIQGSEGREEGKVTEPENSSSIQVKRKKQRSLPCEAGANSSLHGI